MTSDERLQGMLADWLEDQPARAPGQLLDSVITDLQHTPQRARWQVVLRRIPMFRSNQMRLYLAVGVLAVIGVVGFGVWGGLSTPGPGATPTATATPGTTPVPTAVPTPSPTPYPTVNPDTGTWTPYTSTRYGYSIAYPTGWLVSTAKHDWVAESRFELWSSDGNGSDRFINPYKPRDLQEHLIAMSVAVPGETTETAWIDAFETPPDGTTPECVTTADAMEPITIDGHAGRITTSCGNPMSAFVLVDGRMYVFTVDSDDQALFRAFVSTFRLPAPSPS